MKVLLVDDHALFRDGLALLLREVDPAVMVLHAGAIPQALALLSGAEPPDLILLDLNLPGISGVDAVRALRQHAQGVPLVVLSGSEDAQLVMACVDEGAMGFILKTGDALEMMRALRTVFDGGVYLPPLALTRAAAVPAELTALTPRQREVLMRLVQGTPNKTIARDLGISDATVKSHVTGLLQALGVRNRTEAVFAVRHLNLRGPLARLTSPRS